MPAMRHRTAVAAWFYFILAALMNGGVVAPASLDQLLAGSHDVIIGRITGGSVSGVDVHLTIEVERVIKGGLAPGTTLTAAATISEPSAGRSPGLGRGIFFLSGTQGEVRRLVPALSGYLFNEWSTFLPLPEAGYTVELPAAATPKEQVTLEVLAALESGKPRQSGGMIELLTVYRHDPMPTARAVFQRWMRGDSPVLRRMGLRALVAEGDLDALTRMAGDESLKSDPGPVNPYEAVADFKNTDAQAVALLGRLATTPSTDRRLRVAAATALARMHTRQTLPFLAHLLGEDDTALLAAAVGGMAAFANNVPIGEYQPAPGPWPYRTDETIRHSVFSERAIQERRSYFVPFWQNWWQENQHKLTP